MMALYIVYKPEGAQIMALYIVYKPECGQMISAINSQLLAKLHLVSERADNFIREVVWCLRPLANCFIL